MPNNDSNRRCRSPRYANLHRNFGAPRPGRTGLDAGSIAAVCKSSEPRRPSLLQRTHSFGGLGIVLCLAARQTYSNRESLVSERTRPDPKIRSEALQNPRRDQLLQPDRVVAAIRLEPGQTVADIGAGPGYFAFRFARVVGPTGRVYGVDIEPHFIAELERLSRISGLDNVVPVLTSPDSPGLQPASVDVAFFCSVYRHIEDRPGYLRRLRDCLKPNGRIAILEWRKTDALGGELPAPGMPNPPQAERISPEQVIRELREGGFTILERPEFLEHHFFVIAGTTD